MSMQRHHLNIMADVFYRISLPVIAVEQWWANLSGISALSISLENGDQAAFRRTRLMASMAAFWGCPFFGESESLT